MKNTFGHIYSLFLKLLIVLFLFEISRLLFLFYNFKYFNSFSFLEISSTFFYGLLFDISAIVYVNSLFIFAFLIPIYIRENNVFQKILKYIFVISNGIALFYNTIDFEYFRFTAKRSSADIFDVTTEIKGFLISYISDFWHLVFIWILLLGFLIFLYKKLSFKFKTSYSLASILKQIVALFFITGLLIVSARGGFSLRPIRAFDAARFTKHQLIPLVLNTPFKIITTLSNERLTESDYLKKDELNKIYSPIHRPNPDNDFKKKNVVIIILESFGKEYIGYFNQGEGYTPFLDSLCKNSLVFESSFANSQKSVEALPAILSGVPSWMSKPYLNSIYHSNNISSLGKILKDEGYYSAFFHGGENGTMGFDNYIALSGFGDYYGMEQYPDKNDFDGSWGIFDEPYFQYVIDVINNNPKPFCISVFTLSSHHPYKIPEEHKGKFKEGKHPIHKSVSYTDYALERFMKRASQQSWFKNTLFVITADHTSVSLKNSYKNFIGKFSVPIIYYTADSNLVGFNKNISTQQIDIMPSILGYLNYNKAFFCFGKNVFEDSVKFGAIQYNEGIWQNVETPYIEYFDEEKTTSFYKLTTEGKTEINLVNEKSDKMMQMEKRLKAVIQSYRYFLIHNEMVVKEYPLKK
ncbi:MAG: sulfatase-like hydrolase/transferase [Bacteroidota bacterium]|nr:sulfatase-like hydrolase/transferase [Bacteroidota bacterium]